MVLVFSPTKDLYEQSFLAVTTSILLIPQSHVPILGVAWSLSHELLFYALFSLSFFSILLGRLVMLVWGVLICVNVLTGLFDSTVFGAFMFRIFNAEFFFGILVAYLIRLNRIFFPGAFCLGGAILFASAGVFESWGPGVPVEWPPLHFAYATGATAILYGLVGLEMAGRLRMPQLAIAMGEASYSIYLLHVIVIMALQQVIWLAKESIDLPVTPTFLAVVVIAVAVSMLFSRIVEQPLLRYCRKLFKRILKPDQHSRLSPLT